MQEMENLTVKQLAEELGLSKPYVMKRIDQLGLKSRLVKTGNRYLIPVFVADTIRESFNKAAETDHPARSKQDELKQADIIAILQKQLEIKDKQIERLQSENSELVKAIQQSNYLLASSSQDIDEPGTAADPVDTTPEPAADQQPRHRSIFGRFFKR